MLLGSCRRLTRDTPSESSKNAGLPPTVAGTGFTHPLQQLKCWIEHMKQLLQTMDKSQHSPVLPERKEEKSPITAQLTA